MKYRASFPKWRSSLDTHPGIAWNKCPLQMELAHTCFALSLVPVIQAAIGWSFHLLEITHCVSPRFCSACSNMVSDRKRIAKTSCEVTKSFFPRLIDRCRGQRKALSYKPVGQFGLTLIGWFLLACLQLFVVFSKLFTMSKSVIMCGQDTEVYSNERPQFASLTGESFGLWPETLIGLAPSTLVRCACNDPMLSDDPKRKALPPSWGKSFADDIHSRHLNIDVNDRLLICDIFSPPPFPCFAIFNIPTTQGILVTLKSLMVTAPRK